MNYYDSPSKFSLSRKSEVMASRFTSKHPLSNQAPSKDCHDDKDDSVDGGHDYPRLLHLSLPPVPQENFATVLHTTPVGCLRPGPRNEQSR